MASALQDSDPASKNNIALYFFNDIAYELRSRSGFQVYIKIITRYSQLTQIIGSCLHFSRDYFNQWNETYMLEFVRPMRIDLASGAGKDGDRRGGFGDR